MAEEKQEIKFPTETIDLPSEGKVYDENHPLSSGKIEVDGGMGPATLKAIQNLELERVRAYRVLRFANLVIKKPEQERFWFGWYRRAMEV